MTLAGTAGVGLAAGLHGALYGADKDSPHESFLPSRFVREIVIALALAGSGQPSAGCNVRGSPVTHPDGAPRSACR